MNRVEKLEELLSSKSFDELTPAEKELVFLELGSEAQYEAMRKIGVILVKKTAGLSPDPEILKSLQSSVREQKRGTFIMNMLTVRIPLYAPLTLIIFVSLAAWISGNKVNPPHRITIVQTDTVFLSNQPDTVFREKIIYRYVRLKKAFPQDLRTTVQAQPEHQPEIRGVSMKENEVLEKLLVSGSR